VYGTVECSVYNGDTKEMFYLQIKVINQSQYRKAYEEALKWLDKEENKCLPQVVVDIPGAGSLPHSNRNELHFGTVRFLEPVRRSFLVRNVGKVVFYYIAESVVNAIFDQILQ